MEFELKEELVTELGLTPEQTAKLKEVGSNYSADLRKLYDEDKSKEVSKALDAKAFGIDKLTGVKRNDGELLDDYITRATTTHLSTLKSDLETAKNEYLEKAKKEAGNEGISRELTELKAKHDEAQQKLANYDELTDKATKYETLSTEYATMKDQVAYSMVKPSFPETVNPYEADAKWNAFVKKTGGLYTIELVDNEPIAISKENPHKQVKLSDLVAKDDQLMELSKGRQQGGNGATPVDKVKIEGVPFDVKKDSSTAEISKQIKDYLTSIGVDNLSDEYMEKFEDLQKKIKSQQKG